MSWKRLRDSKLQGRLQMRARIVQFIREFFIKEGFLEVETPILVPVAGQEPYLNPMKVRFQGSHSERSEESRPHGRAFARDPSASPQDDGFIDGYLITSPEYAHKKLLAAGFEKTFEITHAFRSGEAWGGLHNPEFAMLEWYRANADYTAIMDDVEKMAQFVATRISPEQAKRVEGPWQRMTVAEAFKRYAGVNLEEVPDEEAFFKIFLTKIERNLGMTKPIILYDYPASMASLARIKKSDPRYAERFEVYIAGIELANAFSELNDAKEQRQRFLEEQKLRKKLGKEIIPLDKDFLDAVGNMPPSAGIALGVDRLVMLLTDAKRIEEVLAFPAKNLFDK